MKDNFIRTYLENSNPVLNQSSIVCCEVVGLLACIDFKGVCPFRSGNTADFIEGDLTCWLSVYIALLKNWNCILILLILIWIVLLPLPFQGSQQSHQNATDSYKLETILKSMFYRPDSSSRLRFHPWEQSIVFSKFSVSHQVLSGIHSSLMNSHGGVTQCQCCGVKRYVKNYVTRNGKNKDLLPCEWQLYILL